MFDMSQTGATLKRPLTPYEQKRARNTAERYAEQLAQMAQKQINIIGVSVGDDGLTMVLVEFHIGNNKWGKFPTGWNEEAPADSMKDIIELVSQAREFLRG